VLGRQVVTLVNEQKQPGIYQVEFSAGALASGMYYYSLNVNGIALTKKMILLK